MSVHRKPSILFSRNIIADMKNFDWEIYLLNYPELVQNGIRTKADACGHYKKIGYWEKRSCSISDKFDAEKYLKTHAHLGLKTHRDAYMHFMKVGSLIKKHEGFKRNIQPYRLPVTTPQTKKQTVVAEKPKPHNQPAFLPRSFIVNRKPGAPPKEIRQAFLPHKKDLVGAIGKPQQVMVRHPLRNTGVSIIKRNIKQPKPGELVLNEPPSSYFRKICTIGPPKYLN